MPSRGISGFIKWKAGRQDYLGIRFSRGLTERPETVLEKAGLREKDAENTCERDRNRGESEDRLFKTTTMSDLKKYIAKRKKVDPEFAEGYHDGYEQFKIGVLFKMSREQAGMTQDEVARKLGTKKSAISRIENHAEDIRLSTLHKYAKALGKKVHFEIV